MDAVDALVQAVAQAPTVVLGAGPLRFGFVDVVSAMVTTAAFRATEARPVPWWRSLVVCFVIARGELDTGHALKRLSAQHSPLAKFSNCFAEREYSVRCAVVMRACVCARVCVRQPGALSSLSSCPSASVSARGCALPPCSAQPPAAAPSTPCIQL
jgi:hypothetical protein